LFAATGTEWIVAYAPVMKVAAQSQAIASAKTVEKCPVFKFKIEARLTYGWISYQKLVRHFLCASSDELRDVVAGHNEHVCVGFTVSVATVTSQS